jgi:metal-responsive CopG/Arc/MetJ family transcriptional regulator
MARSKVAVSLEETTLDRLDQLVRNAVFPNRSQAIQVAVDEKLERIERSRLARECAKLNPAYERALAEEGMSEDLSEWPEY